MCTSSPMDSVASDEHGSTAASLSSVRSIGTAFGAAIAGVVANVAGLGDATEPGAVGHAVTAVYRRCQVANRPALIAEKGDSEGYAASATSPMSRHVRKAASRAARYWLALR